MANHKRIEPTPEQAAVMEFVLAGWRNGATPNREEISEHFGYHRSTSRDHLSRLAEYGLIESRDRNRIYRITKKGMAFDSRKLGLHVHGGCFESST